MKFLHRVRTHDWLGALIELVIVIAGILIALQVSNWNQGRVDRERGARFTQRLVAELASDQRVMGEALDWIQSTGGF
jgi:hypothetical protein